MDLVQDTAAPLGWDERQMPIKLPADAIAWKVRRFTGRPGRPPGVYGAHGVLHLGLDATVADLRRAVRNEPGEYRLYPVNANGDELEPIGCMELVAEPKPPEPAALEPADMTVAMREVLGLCNKMVASRDAHDQLINQVLTTLVTTTATIQRSTAALLGVANTTIQVANGVETIERPEPAQLDTGAVAEQLAEMMTHSAQPAEAGKPQPPWFVQLLNGPVGMGVMNAVNNFAQTIVRAQAQQAAQAAQQAQPPAPTPQPPAPQPPAPQPAPPSPPAPPPTRAAEPDEPGYEPEPEYDEPEPEPRPDRRNARRMSRRERKRAAKAARAARRANAPRGGVAMPRRGTEPAATCAAEDDPPEPDEIDSDSDDNDTDR